MLSYRTWTAIFLTSLAAIATPERADACSPPAPGLVSSTPADGSTYPANATLFFNGFDIALGSVTVTVDGVAASFGAPPAKTPSVATVMATISPTPKAGQKVVISGDFCKSPGQCQPKTISFTTSAPDTEAPPVMDVVAYDVYDYADWVSNGGDCSSSSDLAFWVELQTKNAPAAGESPRIYTIDAYRDSNLQDLALSKSGFVSDADFRVEIRALAKDLGGKMPPEALCFQLSTMDAAGNAGLMSKLLVCKACRYRTDNMPNASVPPEPMWTSADIYAPGPCGMGASSSSSGSGAGGGGGSGAGGGQDDCNASKSCGCACEAGGASESTPGLFAAVALAVGSAAMRSLRRGRRRGMKR